MSYKAFVPQLTIKYTEALSAGIGKLEIDANFDKIAQENGFEYKDDVTDINVSRWKI